MADGTANDEHLVHGARCQDRATLDTLVDTLLAYEAETYLDSHRTRPITREQLSVAT